MCGLGLHGEEVWGFSAYTAKLIYDLYTIVYISGPSVASSGKCCPSPKLDSTRMVAASHSKLKFYDEMRTLIERWT